MRIYKRMENQKKKDNKRKEEQKEEKRDIRKEMQEEKNHVILKVSAVLRDTPEYKVNEWKVGRENM